MGNGEWNEGMTNKELIIAIHERLDEFNLRLARKPDRAEVLSIIGGLIIIAGIVIQSLV